MNKNKMNLRCLMALLCLWMGITASALEFTINGFRYSTNADGKTCSVRFVNGERINQYPRNVIIPATIEYNNVIYTITEVLNHAGTTGHGVEIDTLRFAPDSKVVILGKNAFSESTVKYVELPNSLTDIMESAFQNCSNLESITIPARVEVIGDKAFSGCSLKSVSLNEGLKVIGNNAFNFKNRVRLVLPSSLESIGDYAFRNLKGEVVFAKNGNLKSIGSYAFAFGDIRELSIPQSVQEIKYGAFLIDSLKTVQVFWSKPSEVSTDNSAFYGTRTKYMSLYVPKGSIPYYKNATPWSGFKYIYENPTLAENLIIEDELTIIQGEQRIIEFTIFPQDVDNKTLMWLSLNPSVVTVNSSGTVTGVTAGVAQVVATTTDGSNLSDTCTVTVTPIYATSISLNMNTLNLISGDTCTLTATILPSNTANKTVTWESSDTSVVIVNNEGLVTAKAVGAAAITANTTDGSNLSASCAVIVTSSEVKRGDMNGDGFVDVGDVAIIIDFVLGKGDPRGSIEKCDLNDDGVVDVSDVNIVIDIVLGKEPSGDDEPATQTYTVNGISFDMVSVHGGTFNMGATAEQGTMANDNEKPVHQVTVSDFSIGQTEVTQELWKAVMGYNASKFSARGGYDDDFQRPVEMVTRVEALEFISRLNQLTGETFRLPTEAEWEFAARGGNKSKGTMYAGSNDPDQVAWCAINSGKVTHAVGTKAPNELGLYDMSGNVYEWCSDYFGDYSSAAQTNPTGPSSGETVVVRGASWYHAIRDCRVSARLAIDPARAYDSLGIRLAK